MDQLKRLFYVGEMLYILVIGTKRVRRLVLKAEEARVGVEEGETFTKQEKNRALGKRVEETASQGKYLCTGETVSVNYIACQGCGRFGSRSC